MALTEEQLKTELESYLKKLAGVMPIGHYWFGIDPKSKPAGVQIYSGQLLARSAYQKHWEFVSGGHRTVLSEAEWQSMVTEQGFCPYFSDGDGSTTYRMPLVKNVHPKFVAALVEAGDYTEAGLPNHEHFIANTDSTSTYNSLSSSNTLVKTGGAGDSAAWLAGTSTEASIGKTNLASVYDPIYGNSDTVQPEAISILIGEYVIGTIATIGEANAESLLASVTQLEAGKLDKTGGGVSGNLSVSGDLFVGGQINASISGTSENAVKASQDAQGRVIDETYATKSEVSGYLPLSGGKLTGSLQFFNKGNISYESSIPYIFMRYEENGDVTGSGIYFRPYNTDSLPGSAVISTRLPDNTEGKNFIFEPNGGLSNQLGYFPYIIEKSGNNANWYRKWSDGLIEQCGYVTANSYVEGITTVTFIKPFSKSYPTVIVAPNGGGTRVFTLAQVTITGFKAQGWNRSTSAAAPPYIFYYAAGY